MEDVIVETLNLSKICRVCLSESETMHSIYSQLQISDSTEDETPCIYEILMSVSEMKVEDVEGVEQEDGLPSMICACCIECAESSYKFRRQCNRSQAILEAYLLQARLQGRGGGMDREEGRSPGPVPVPHHAAMEDSDDSSDGTVTTFVPLNLVLIESGPRVATRSQPQPQGARPADARGDREEVVVGEAVAEVKQTATVVSTGERKRTVPEVEVERDNETGSCQRDLDSGGLCGRRPEQQRQGQDKGKTQVKGRSRKGKNGLKSTIKWIRTESGEKVYACGSCSKTYKHAGSLRIHERGAHGGEDSGGGGERPYVCGDCGKGYRQHTSLVYHRRGHTGERPYACQLCGNRYRQAGTLTAHMRVHTGQRPFLCSVCGRGFRQAPDLTYHMRTHTKERPYMCNVCGKTMTMQCHLVQHMRSHTGERPFHCSVCGKAFPSSTRLKRHAIIHTGLKPYACEVCGKAFNRSSSLRVHAKIHTDDRPHQCPVCARAFIQAHALKAHVATHAAAAETAAIATDTVTAQ